jgi:hypothetical protein
MSLLCCVASVGVIILPFSFAPQPLKFTLVFWVRNKLCDLRMCISWERLRLL